MKRAITNKLLIPGGMFIGEFHTFDHLIEKQMLIRKLQKLKLKKINI